MEKVHYEVLEFVDNTRGTWRKKEDICNNIDYPTKEVEDAINYLKKSDMLKKSSSDKRYRILPKGIELLSTKELRDSINQLDSSITDLEKELGESINDLHNFQSKSSAVETVFTLALIVFAYLQLVKPSLGYHIPEIILIIGIVWALLVGGLTPFKMTWKQLKRIKNVV